MSSISGIVISKNEEKQIEACLKSLSFCDEIIVIDDYSTDNTLKIAKKFTSKIYQRKLENNFSSQRNFALTKTKSDWVLFIDADEIITDKLKNEILNAIKNENINGYYLKRVDNIWGWRLSHGEILNLKLLRLARHDKANWTGLVHEVMNVKGEIGNLKTSIEHFPHSSVSEFLASINFYSSLRAQELFEEKHKTNVFEIIFYPKAKFIQNYLFKMGFLDGTRGFVFALMMSFHSFLVRGKLWQLWEKHN